MRAEMISSWHNCVLSFPFLFILPDEEQWEEILLLDKEFYTPETFNSTSDKESGEEISHEPTSNNKYGCGLTHLLFCQCFKG
jgi:hypothetical protein